MTGIEIALAVALGLIVNEFTDISPWAARTLVAWSARCRYGATTRAGIRAEELAAVINDRPGKLFKLCTAIGFAAAAIAARLRQLVYGDNEPAYDADKGRLPLVRPEPSPVISRFLFPAEGFRGEWRRHWIHLAKGLGMVLLYGVLGVWAAVVRIKPQYVGWVVTVVVVLVILTAALNVLSWLMARFVITNKRLMSSQGVLFRRVATMPLHRVTDLRYVQTPLGRVLNYGTFMLESASRRNAMRKIVHLPNPNELYLRLVEEMYEPEAVKARLAHFESENSMPDAERTADDRRSVYERTALQREIIARIHMLSAELAALATAMDTDTPGSGTQSNTDEQIEPVSTPCGRSSGADRRAGGDLLIAGTPDSPTGPGDVSGHIGH